MQLCKADLRSTVTMSHWCNNHSRGAVRSRPRRACSESGSSLLETALVMPLLLLMMAAAVDFGRAYSIAIEVSSAAHAGALYGTHSLSDTSGMVAAVKADATDLTTMTSTAIYGCKCAESSGTGVSSCTTPPTTCSQNYVNYVQVSASDVYTPLFPYPGIPATITLQKTVEMRSGGD